MTAALVAGAGPARANPDLEATLGGTLAISGTPDDGGWSVSLSPMWDVHDRWLFGVMLFADDMGTEFGQLVDPNDGSDRGTVQLGHTHVLGAAWRLDREWGSITTWLPYVSGTWGYYRLLDDVRGEPRGREGSTGFSLAGGVRRAVSDRQAIGVSVRYHRLFNDHVGRYVGWGVDWSFH